MPLASCLCALVVPVANEVELLVLQHPREADEAKGSVRLLAACLARCRVMVGEVFEPEVLADRLHGDGRRSALLYPETEVAWIASATTATASPPNQLVLLDGTWRKSLRLLGSNPLLQALPRRALRPDGLVRYAALRHARRPGQLSSLEAACLALGELERTSTRYAPLLSAFESFVEIGVARARGGRDVAADL